MRVPALLLLILPALLPPASTADPGQPCPSEMNKVKDLLEVNCTEQGLSAVPSDLPEDTGILLLSTNRLTSVSTAAFLPLTRLQDLDLSDNRLVALDTGSPLCSLKELILSHNVLQALPALKGLPALTRLAMAYNSLAALDPGAFRDVSLLQDLDLRGNQLRKLPQEAFEGLRELKDLDLSDNLLEELPKELLQGLEKLETLWLSGNRLQTLPTDFFPEGHTFMYVFLTENPWHCDCDLLYLRRWIRQNDDSVYQPERGLEKTKVEVAPEKVLCQSPDTYQLTPIIHFKPNCGNVGDADEDEEEDYYSGEETAEKATTVTFARHPSTPTEHTTVPQAVTWPPLTTTRPPSSTPPSSTLAPSTLLAMPMSTRAPTTATPVPASPTIAPTETPSTATVLITAPASTPHKPTTLLSTTSTTMSTRPPSTSSHPQTTLATSTTNTYSTLMLSTGTFSTTPTAVPSTASPEASSTVRSSPPPLTSTMLVGSTTALSTRAPTPLVPLDTIHTTQPAPSPPPAPVPLCPCFSPARAVPVWHSRAGREGLQGGQWVLRHCCLLHWLLYLVSLALLVLTVLALMGWLVWMCLVGRVSWHKPPQVPEVQYPLMKVREWAESPAMHLSSFKSPPQRPIFCTIKEVELCPEVTYCTIKDLGLQRNPPPGSSFRTTKELWVHRSPPNASFNSFSSKLMLTNPGFRRTPSAYSLDRGVEAIGDVRVRYAGNTL